MPTADAADFGDVAKNGSSGNSGKVE